MVGNCICDDAVCCAASRMEILRRYYTACVERLRGKAGDEPVRKLELAMQQAGVPEPMQKKVLVCLEEKFDFCSLEDAEKAGYRKTED